MDFQQAPQSVTVLTPNSDLRRYSRECLRGNWGTMIAAFVMVGVIMMALLIPYYVQTFSQSFSRIQEGLSPFELMSQMYTSLYFLTMFVIYFITPAFTVGMCALCLRLIRTRTPEFNDIFSGFKVALKAFGATFMCGVFTTLWSMLFVIPGIIAAFSYMLVPYILSDNPNIGAFDAISLSKKMMRGAKFKAFCMAFSFIGWMILCSFTLGIGYLWLYPYMTTSMSSFYEDVSRRYYATT